MKWSSHINIFIYNSMLLDQHDQRIALLTRLLYIPKAKMMRTVLYNVYNKFLFTIAEGQYTISSCH